MKLSFSGDALGREVEKELQALFEKEKGEVKAEIAVAPVTENRYERKGNAFRMTVGGKGAALRGFLHLLKSGGKDFSVTESCPFSSLGAMLDCSRNAVYTVDTVKRLIRILALLGYNSLQLYTEDTYELNDNPFFGYLRGKYTKEELREIDRYAAEHGVELIPCVQTLAHLHSIFRWYPYVPINDISDILLVGDDKTYEFIDKIFETLEETFTSRRVNVGMDEAHLLGRGKFLEKNGLVSRPEIMKKHVERVVEIARKHGFKCMMWSDMFFRLAFGGEYYAKEGQAMDEAAIAAVPKGLTLIYWDYYSDTYEHYDQMFRHHEKFDNPIAFAGGLWSWKGFAPSNRYSNRITEPAIRACREHRTETVFFTMWGDNGAETTPFSLLPALSLAAERAFGKGEDEARADVFALTGLDYDDFMALEDVDEAPKPSDSDTPNPSKYLLFNDPLLGVLDFSIPDGWSEVYRGVAERLRAAEERAKGGEWEYLFRAMRALAEVLEYKCDIGLRARALYEKKDKKGMAELVRDRYTPLIARTEAFYAAFLDEWNHDKKPHGFDVQDIRLGGLIRRLTHAAAVLGDYAAGKIDRVPELEEPRLDTLGEGEHRKASICFNYWGFNATSNVML